MKNVYSVSNSTVALFSIYPYSNFLLNWIQVLISFIVNGMSDSWVKLFKDNPLLFFRKLACLYSTNLVGACSVSVFLPSIWPSVRLRLAQFQRFCFKIFFYQTVNCIKIFRHLHRIWPWPKFSLFGVELNFKATIDYFYENTSAELVFVI
jgi:hypothetical protein